MNLILAGNLIQDTILLENGDARIRSGGIGNVARALKSLRRKHCLLDSFYNGSYAKVSVLKDGRSKLVFDVKINTTTVFGAKAKWLHVSYLNKVRFQDIQALRNKCDVLSADICAGGDKTWASYAPYFDYLFFADDEYDGICARKATIIHGRERCCMIGVKEKIEIRSSKVYNDIVILGAGDYFAAAFIHQMMNEDNEVKSLCFAARETPKLLRKLNDF